MERLPGKLITYSGTSAGARTVILIDAGYVIEERANTVITKPAVTGTAGNSSTV